MDYADIVSSIALVASIIALGWNIVRDLISDRVAVQLFIAFGEAGNIKGTITGLFADAGSLTPEHKFDNPNMIVQITNVGRKPVGLSTVGGKYKNDTGIFIAVDGLPKMLQPYEMFCMTSVASKDFIEAIEKNEVKDLWVADTTGKTWSISERGWERLRRTAKYIVSEKHL